MSGPLIGWLLSGLGWLRRAIGTLIALALRHPWQAACALLLAGGIVLWRGEHHAIAERDAARATIAQMRDASAEAARVAQARRKADEQHYKELADDADARHRDDAARADHATAAYLALHRLRAGAAAGPGDATIPQTQSGGAGVPQDPTAGAVMVAVSEADVKTCAADYSYAKAAYDWAMALDD